VFAGYHHTCALKDDGSTWCWGANGYGEAGQPASSTNLAVPTRVAAAPSALSGSAGDGHTCIVAADATGWCWGANMDGELGDGTAPTARATPGQVPGLTDLVQIAAGANHNCALTRAGAVHCWGQNSDGELGDGSFTGRTTPVALTGLEPMVEVGAGVIHSCARTQAGAVWCWGANFQSQLGPGSADMHSAIPVHSFDGAIGITVGGFAVCARKADDTVWCWGDYGQNTIWSPTPTQIFSEVVGIAEGWRFECAIGADGTLRCLGVDTSGQLGNGRAEPFQTSPVQAMGLTDVAAVTAGEAHTCALAAGALYCWGDNMLGELGTGDGVSSARPGHAALTCP
jgi:alpha-tubulin suppressor-like RCC1 family protein